jgi:hypothetical protein
MEKGKYFHVKAMRYSINETTVNYQNVWAKLWIAIDLVLSAEAMVQCY